MFSNKTKIFVIAVGGRASGVELTRAAQSLGFRVVHVYPDNLPDDVTASFAANHYDFDPITYSGDLTLHEAAIQVSLSLKRLAERETLTLAGVSPGMDFGVGIANELAIQLNMRSSVPSLELMSILSDKLKFNDLMEKRGVPVARSSKIVVPSDGLAIVIPNWVSRETRVFYKPVQGYASQASGFVRPRKHRARS